MDPYIERHWEDVHTRLIGYVADALQPQLADDLVARMEEKVYVEDAGDLHRRRPDVRVVEFPTASHSGFGGLATAAAVLDEPMELELVGDPIRERNVLIYDAAGRRVVTAIEILSPWNKSSGKAVAAYLEKRDKYVNSDVNLVEIDLIRTGDWTSMIGPYHVPDRADDIPCHRRAGRLAEAVPLPDLDPCQAADDQGPAPPARHSGASGPSVVARQGVRDGAVRPHRLHAALRAAAGRSGTGVGGTGAPGRSRIAIVADFNSGSIVSSPCSHRAFSTTAGPSAETTPLPRRPAPPAPWTSSSPRRPRRRPGRPSR
jgi:hypothetical protein